MKSPADYLLDAWQPTLTESGSHVPTAQAERALAQALADAADEKQKYAHLLARAIRNAKQPQF